MLVKLECSGVRALEASFFGNFNKYYHLTLEELLMNDRNIEELKHAKAVMICENCKANRQNIKKLASYGVKYLLTKTDNFNNVDLEAANDFGIQVGKVPNYSPNPASELALSLAMRLLREIHYSTDDFIYSKEIRNCTVGILGTDKVGLETAKLFRGLGAKTVAYDILENESAKQIVEYLSLDDVLATSDIISVHMSYFKYSNYKLINKEFIDKMKDDAILINMSSWKLQDSDAILQAIMENTLGGFGADELYLKRNS